MSRRNEHRPKHSWFTHFLRGAGVIALGAIWGYNTEPETPGAQFDKWLYGLIGVGVLFKWSKAFVLWRDARQNK